MSEYARFTKDVAIVGVTQVVLALRGLILLPIISKLLGVSEYGIWAQVMVTVGLATPIFQLGLTTALIRFIAAEKDRRQIQEGFFSVLSTVLACSLAVALILVFLAEPISSALFDGVATTIVHITAAIVFFLALETVCSSFFLAFRQTWTYSILILAKSFGEIGLVAGMILAGFGILGAVLSVLISVSITGVVALCIVVSQIGLKRPEFTSLKPYLKFGLPLVPTTLFALIIESSDRYVIGYFLGVAEVGIYSAIYALINVVSYYRLPLMRILRPTLSKSYDEGRIAEVQTYLRYSLKYLLMLTIASLVGLSILGKEILRVFTTTDFLSFSYFVILFLVIAKLLEGIMGISGSQVLVLIKKTKVVAVAYVIAALANLVLNLVFVPRFGIVAAAGTTLLAYALATVMLLYFALHQLTFKVDWLAIMKSLVASGIMAAAIFAIKPAGAWQLFLVIGLGVVVYAVALLLLKGLSRDEIRFFPSLLRRTPPIVSPNVEKEI